MLIRDLVKDNSQFVSASYSPIWMAYPEAWIYHLSTKRIAGLDSYETSTIA